MDGPQFVMCAIQPPAQVMVQSPRCIPKEKYMRVLETRVYRGPSPYGSRTVIRLTGDPEELEQYPTNRLPGFNERLVELIPTLQEHGCSYGEPGGFIRRLREGEGTWLGHVAEHIAIELQCLAGTPVTYGKTRSTPGQPGVYYVVYSFIE